MTDSRQSWSALDYDAATRRAFWDAWAYRHTSYAVDAVAHLVACAERAVDDELARRLELAQPIRYNRAKVAAVSLDELTALLAEPSRPAWEACAA